MIDDLQCLENQLGRSSNHPNIAASVVSGEIHLTPVFSELLEEFENLQLRLLYTNRTVNLSEERIDVSARIGHLQDFSLLLGRSHRQRDVCPVHAQYCRWLTR